MAVYRYHVIVDTEIQTGGSQKGETEARSQLERMERQARDSHKRRLDDESKLNNELRRLSDERIRNDQRIASEGARFHQERFNKQIQDSANYYSKRNEQIQQNARIEREADQAAINRTKDRFRTLLAQHAEIQATEQRVSDLNRQIIARDPFQNLGARSQSLGAAGRDLRSDETQRFNRQIQQLDPFQNLGGRQRSLQEAARDIRQFDDVLRQNSRSMSQWGQAFRGAFIGAVAGFTFYALAASIVVPIKLLGQLGVAGIEAAGRLETTTNALKVFTGSTQLAREELRQIDEVARTTAGLRLETAEVGYQRLRALGFQADITRGFIKELGEERILSGAEDEALERVIFNFAQIASGGQRVSQEIREIVTQMPTLQQAFEDAFGTTNPQLLEQIKNAQGVDAFIKQLLDTMSEGEAASAGLEDAIGKLQDAGISLGRTFGEPIVDPLTDAVIDLTDWLYKNEDVVRNWGQVTADVLRGTHELVGLISTAVGKLREDWGFLINTIPQAAETAARQIPGASAVIDAFKTARAVADFTRERGQTERELEGRLTPEGRLAREREREEKERLARERVERRKAQREAESERQQELEKLKASSKEATAILQSRFEVEQAALDANIRYTTAQELEYAKASGDIRKRAIEAEIAQVGGYYSKLIELEGAGSKGAIEAQSERNVKLTELNAKLKQEEFKTQKEIQEAERRILDERREQLIEFKNIQIQQIEQANEATRFNLTQQLESGGIGYKEFFDEQIRIATESGNELVRINREILNLQLQDRSLTEQQIVNLKAESALKEKQLTMQTAQEVDRIQKESLEIQKRRLSDYIEFITSSYSSASDFIQNFAGLLFGQGSTGARSDETFNAITSRSSQRIGDFENQLKALSQKENTFADLVDNFRKGDTAAKAMLNTLIDAEVAAQNFGVRLSEEGFIAETINGFTRLRASVEAQKESFIEAEKTLKPLFARIKQIKDAFDFTPEGVDKLDRDLLLERQNFDLANLNERIKLQESIVKNTVEGIEKDKERYVLLGLLNERNVFGIKSLREQEEQFRESIKGIQEYNKALAEGDKQAVAFAQNRAIRSRESDVSSLLEQIIALNDYLQNGGTNEYLNAQVEVLQHIVDLRFREYEYIARITKAQLDIRQQTVFNATKADAEFFEFLASQKGITEIMSDARIGAISAAYSQLDAVIGKLTQRFGAFGDVIKDLLSNLIKLALNQVFQRLLGGTGGGTGGGGGFNLSNIFGGGGFQSTPGFAGGQLPIFGNQGILGAAGFGGAGAGGVGTTASVFDLSGNIVGTQTAGLLRPGSAGGASQSGGLAGFLSQFGAGGLTGGLLGGALGASLGGGSVLGSVLGGIGGGIAGLGIAGLLAGFSFTALGAATFGVGLALLPLAYILGRNSKRRKEEQQRNTAILDAFRQIDELIQNVNNDRIDGAQALSQAEQIRAQYVEQMSQLKDSKTRRHALADVSRIDSKITDLKAAVDRQRSRQEYQQLLVPTFADGGATSTFIQKSVKRNPLGYQYGGEAMGYFPKANTLALYNERGSEYILDAETTKAIGIEMLDQIRATKGASFNSMRKKISIPSREAGGAVATPTLVTQPVSSAGVASTGGGRTVERTTVNVYLAKETFVEFIREIVSENNGSDEQINRILDRVSNDGAGGRFGQVATKFVRENLKP